MRRGLSLFALGICLACARETEPPANATDLAVTSRPAPAADAIADNPIVPRDTMPTRDAAQVADVDCDGRADSVVFTRADSLITLVVYRAADTSVMQLNVPVGNYQNGVCSRQAVLVLEDQRSGPDPEEFGKLPGFVPSESCMGFRLDDGDCDAFHVYWNRDLQRFGSWRY